MGATISALVLLVTMTGGAVGGLWLAVVLVINPESVNTSEWLRAILPEADTLRQAPQTVLEIQAELESRDRFPTTPILLPSAHVTTWLLPVATPLPQCQHRQTLTMSPALNSSWLANRWDGLEVLVPGCQRIVELWLYQPLPQQPGQPSRYERLQQVTVNGPPEFRVSDAYRHAANRTGSNEQLPLTHIQFLSDRTEVFPEAGQWLTTTGRWQRGDDRSLYGQLVYYDPQRQQLYPSIVWSSPAEALPAWQSVTGDHHLELVLNQTVGLEPAFEIFVQNPGGRLQAISLLDTESLHPAYQQAIALAQAKLWSPALEQMSIAQADETAAGRWSAAAQAQQDAIALHAQVTQAHAQQSWSTPGQQLTAYLLDAQWGEGLDFFEQHINDHRTELRSVLASSRFWRRINTAVQVDANNEDITAWVALLLSVRRGQPAAIAWLTNTSDHSQPMADSTIPDRLRGLLNALEAPAPPPSITATRPDPELARSTEAIAPGRILGTAVSVSPDQWVSASRRLSAEQTPYQVTITAFDDGSRWQRSPFRFNAPSSQTLPDAFGIAPATPLTLFSWVEPASLSDVFQPIQTTAELVRLEPDGRQVTAWVIGDRAIDYGIAATRNVLQPLSPSLISLSDFQAQNAQLAAILERQLRLTLQQDGFATVDAIPYLFDRLEGTVARADLTQDGRLDVVLRLSANALSDLYPDVTADYTLIVSAQGDRLYGAANGDGLVGIVQIETDTPALVIDTGNEYQLRRWSTTAQQFE